MKDTLKNWRNCGWSATQQQHSKHDKANGGIKDVKTCRIFAINTRKWGTIRGESEMAKLWLEWNSTTTQKARKPERNNRGEKYADRLEMSVQMGTTLVWWIGITLGCVWYQKTSGLPIVGDSKTIHISKSRPFWNKYLFIGMVWFTVTQAKTTLVEHIPTTINEDPTS